MRTLPILLLCAPAAVAQTTTQVALNYNFNGIVHVGEEGAPDDPNGYRSISDRGLNFTGGVPSDPMLDQYTIVSSPTALDIVHLGNRNTVTGNLFPFDAAPNADDIGVQPAWLTNVDQSGPQTTLLSTPITLNGGSEASFLYQISNGGGSFDVVFLFLSGAQLTRTLGGGDWFGGDYLGTSNIDFALFENNLSITEGVIDLGDSVGEILTSITFQNRSNTDAGYAIIAANITVGATPQPTVQIPLNYNFNGIVHPTETGLPDDPNGFRSVSDRALDFTAGVPSDPLLSSYALVDQPDVLDIVHLGNRDTVAAGVWAFQPAPDGDNVGTQPNWLTTVDQSGPQTTALPSPLFLGSGASAKFIYQISNDGGYFDVTCGFQSGASMTTRLGGGDWALYGGAYAGAGFVDNGWTDSNVSITEGYFDLSGAVGEVLTHITFSNASNPISACAIIGAKVMGGAVVGTTYCTGDGSSIVCPCGNPGGSDSGCANGTGSGAALSSTGTNSVGAADFSLIATHLVPNEPGLYFQGNNATANGAGLHFGDGIRCAGGAVIRLQTRFADADGESHTSANIISLGGVAVGDTKRYQLWYRDPALSPCGAQFNLSNGYEVTWTP